MNLFFRSWFILILCLPLPAAPKKAKNVILFLADAGGLPTVSAASLHGYGAPQKLFIQSWPNIALSDTTAASNWVTDSAAGMTAIVTGVKTHNGVISQGPDAIKGKKDGIPLKTILEYAEERGLSTGVVSNVNIADATPAACYAQANDRATFAQILPQLFNPRFGDGVDVVIGSGRKAIHDSFAKSGGGSFDDLAHRHKRAIYADLASIPADESRPVAVLDKGMQVPDAAKLAIARLSTNRKGYFLMIEWDSHTDDLQRGLDNVVSLDNLIREISSIVDPDNTLLLFTADHSYELRTVGGHPGQPLLGGLDAWKAANKSTEPIAIPAVRVGKSHTGEEVVVAAMGPGSEQVRGFLPNTRLFTVMMNAFGWKPDRK